MLKNWFLHKYISCINFETRFLFGTLKKSIALRTSYVGHLLQKIHTLVVQHELDRNYPNYSDNTKSDCT